MKTENSERGQSREIFLNVTSVRSPIQQVHRLAESARREPSLILLGALRLVPYRYSRRDGTLALLRETIHRTFPPRDSRGTVVRRSLLNIDVVSLRDMASVVAARWSVDRRRSFPDRTVARPSSQIEVRRRGGVVRLRAGASGRRGGAGPAARPGSGQGRATGHVGAALRTTVGASAALLRRVGGRVPVAVVVRGVCNERERRLR